MKKPTNFCVIFQVDNTKYCYELTMFDSVIQEENLYSQEVDKEAEAVFERDEEGVYLCSELECVDIDRMNESLPLLSYITIFKDIEIKDVYTKHQLENGLKKELGRFNSGCDTAGRN